MTLIDRLASLKDSAPNDTLLNRWFACEELAGELRFLGMKPVELDDRGRETAETMFQNARSAVDALPDLPEFPRADGADEVTSVLVTVSAAKTLDSLVTWLLEGDTAEALTALAYWSVSRLFWADGTVKDADLFLRPAYALRQLNTLIAVLRRVTARQPKTLTLPLTPIEVYALSRLPARFHVELKVVKEVPDAE